MEEGEQTRRCSKCGEEKVLSAFSTRRTSKSGKQCHCKECARVWFAANPEKRAASGRRTHLAKYGLTEADYYFLYASQHGCCAICGRHYKAGYLPESRGTGRGRGPHRVLNVEHCHRTGKVRALVCNDCNLLIGYMEKQREYIGTAWRYVIAHDRGELCNTELSPQPAN